MLLLIDNYDSFTYNLVHFLGVLGAHMDVRRHDEISVADALALKPQAIILSPGPGRPHKAGISVDLVQAAAKKSLPVLGVCLGHQAVGEAFGAKIVRAQEPVHGKLSPIFHEQDALFKNIPSPFEAARYHSLVIEEKSLPPCFRLLAKTKDGAIMAIKHEKHPLYGVQFHPESIASEYGHEILGNFLLLSGLKLSKKKGDFK